MGEGLCHMRGACMTGVWGRALARQHWRGRRTAPLTGDALRIEGSRIRFTLPDFQPGALSIRLSSGNSGPIITCNTRCELTEGVVTLETEVR
ncbi:MAG TPA: hypothetical protein VE057_27045 [Archangium sp.]|nr:hypothetical protein [Archangium sp.]